MGGDERLAASWAGMKDAFGVSEAYPELHLACLEEIRPAPYRADRVLHSTAEGPFLRRRLGEALLASNSDGKIPGKRWSDFDGRCRYTCEHDRERS